MPLEPLAWVRLRLGLDPIARAIRAHVTPGCLVLDVGANRGSYTRVAARLGARVAAFEPHPEHARTLRARHIPGVSVWPLVVSDRVGCIAFHLDTRPGMHGVASSILTLEGLSDGRTVNVQTTTIDTWCAETGSVPALIKIDAEGAEPLILEGARETIRRHRPVLIFELWESPWPRFKPAVTDLCAQGYTMSRIADGAPVPEVYRSGVHSGLADVLAVADAASVD